MSDVSENMIGTRGLGRGQGSPAVNIRGRAYTRPATVCNLGIGADKLPKYVVLDNALSPEGRDKRIEALRKLAVNHRWVDPKAAKKVSTKVSIDESA